MYHQEVLHPRGRRSRGCVQGQKHIEGRSHAGLKRVCQEPCARRSQPCLPSCQSMAEFPIEYLSVAIRVSTWLRQGLLNLALNQQVSTQNGSI